MVQAAMCACTENDYSKSSRAVIAVANSAVIRNASGDFNPNVFIAANLHPIRTAA